jgi:endonuclease YncB( thermonuclease family)
MLNFVLAAFMATVVHTSDGDTITIRAENCSIEVLCTRKVRIVGIDSPESRYKKGGGRGYAKCKLEARKGLITKAKAKEILDGKSVKVIPLALEDQADPYGRLLATIILADGRSYADVIAAQAYAVAYDPQKAKSFAKSDWCSP